MFSDKEDAVCIIFINVMGNFLFKSSQKKQQQRKSAEIENKRRKGELQKKLFILS